LRTWTRVLIAILVAGGSAANSALAAAPGVVGPPFLAGDRAIPQENNQNDFCSDAEGRTYRLRSSSEDKNDPARSVAVEREDAGGNALSPIPLDPRAWPYWIQCSPAGSVLVAVEPWDLDARHEILAFDSDGRALGSFTMEQQVFWYSRFALHDSAGIYVIRTNWDDSGVSVSGQWLGYDGEPLSSAVELREKTLRGPTLQTVAFDSAGNVLVILSEDTETGNWQLNLDGRMVDADGNLLGPAFRVNEDLVPNGSGAISAIEEAVGAFTVYWYSDVVDGRMGRTVSIDPDSVIPVDVTTTTLPAVDDNLTFGPEHRIGSISARTPDVTSTALISDGAGTWLASWWQPDWSEEDGYYSDHHLALSRSLDNGRHWEAIDSNGLLDYARSIAMSADGTVMAATLGWNGGIRVVRSDDGGSHWNAVNDLALPPLPDAPGPIFREGGGSSAIATDGAGTWSVAWSVYEWNAATRTSAARISIVFTYDNGETWQPPIEIWHHGPPSTHVDLALDTDGRGKWILAWQTDWSHEILTVSSTTYGLTWDQPRSLLRVHRFVYPDPRAYERTWSDSLDLRHAAGDHWLLSFASSAWDLATYGADGDIFAMNSSDNGENWSPPSAVNGQARVDAATDASPSLAVDAHGNAMMAWKTHDSLGDLLGNDGDIVRATSSDFGATWSWPQVVNSGARADSSAEDVPVVAAGGDGVWLAAWQTWRGRSGWTNRDLVVAASPYDCGDFVVDPAEECDDGNDTVDDGCDPNCTLGGCGNGVINDGEECDDANILSDDACLEDCREATCGDGVHRPEVEVCDDGATNDNGACLQDCTYASCLDGHVQVGLEECDDGNTDGGDSCNNQCDLAHCGDGYVWSGHEECDDHNSNEHDGCTSSCTLATCGDGVVWKGVEQCDPGGPPIPFHPCRSDCRFTAACEGTTPVVRYKATDALVILRVAVGLDASCALPLCDLNDNGRVTVIDALAALQMAVAQLDSEDCAASTTVAFVLGKSPTLMSFQFDVDFAAGLGTFGDGNGNAECSGPLPQVLVATNARLAGRLRVGTISLAGFAGPVDLFWCTFHHVPGNLPIAADFALKVLDATDLIGNSPAKVPTVRVEIR